MNALQIIFILIIILAGYPLGLLLAYFTKEELRAGRLFFKIIMSICLLVIITSGIFSKGQNLVFLLAISIFIFLMTLASYIKSKPKK